MKANVKLYGTLSWRFPGYRPDAGLELELPEGATAKDMLVLLGLSAVQGAVVIAAGRVLKTNDALPPGTPAQVFQSIYGG